MLITDDRTKYKAIKRAEFDRKFPRKFPSKKHNSNVYNIGDTVEYDGIYRCISSLSPNFIFPRDIEITIDKMEMEKKDEKFPPHTFKEYEKHHDIEWSLIATHDGEKVYVVDEFEQSSDRFDSSYEPNTNRDKLEFANGIYTIMKTTTKVFIQGVKIPLAPLILLGSASLVVASNTEENRKILGLPPKNK